MPLRRHQRVSIRAIALTHHKPLPDTHPDTALHAAILDGPPDPDAGRLGTGDPPRMMQGLTRLQALIPAGLLHNHVIEDGRHGHTQPQQANEESR